MCQCVCIREPVCTCSHACYIHTCMRLRVSVRVCVCGYKSVNSIRNNVVDCCSGGGARYGWKLVENLMLASEMCYMCFPWNATLYCQPEGGLTHVVSQWIHMSNANQTWCSCAIKTYRNTDTHACTHAYRETRRVDIVLEVYRWSAFSCETVIWLTYMYDCRAQSSLSRCAIMRLHSK